MAEASLPYDDYVSIQSLSPEDAEQLVLSVGIQVPSQKVIGDYLCRLGGPKYLLRRYVDP